mgnify:CR=1 FL=1
MPETQTLSVAGGNTQQRPPLMTRRFEFESYAQTRSFLDLLTGLSERTGYYPDLNFGKTYVSVNIAPDAGALAETEFTFAAEAAGVFAAPSVIAEGLARQYGVRPIGRIEEIRERFYAITTERRLKHPAVTAIFANARRELFPRA